MNYPPTPIPKLTPSSLNPPGLLTPQHSEESEESSSPKLKKVPPKGNILHVSNICPSLNYEQIKQGLYKLFSSHGPIYQIVIKTKQKGQHFAFVDYPEIKDAEKAVQASKKNPKFFEGRELIVNYCEDPRKNNDRKDQKCFLCHDSGHKAIKCPNKPELIKPKLKKSASPSRTDEDISSTGECFRSNERISPRKRSMSPSSDSESERSQRGSRRDKDYLRFLKLKKQILQKKLRKKMQKERRRRRK